MKKWYTCLKIPLWYIFKSKNQASNPMPMSFSNAKYFYIKKHGGGMQTQARPLRGGDKKPSKNGVYKNPLKKSWSCYIIKVWQIKKGKKSIIMHTARRRG